MRTKLVLGLLLAVAAMLMLVVPTAAANGTGASQDEQWTSTNVPYLAWSGEEVRLVKCYDPPTVDAVVASTTNLQAALVDPEFNVLRWTGGPRDPALENNTVTAFMNGKQLCVRGDFVSLDPGLATIEMDVAIDWGLIYVGQPDQGLVKYPKHTFLAAWMTLLKPTLGELSDAGLTGLSANQDLGAQGAVVNLLHGNYSTPDPSTSKAVATEGVMLGDPPGDGNFYPIADENGVKHLYDGLLSVKVKGQFPDPAAPGGVWTMPDDWAALAGVYESDILGHNPEMWDIHNALSWDPGALLEGSIVDPTVIGPFDPLILETVLSNTKLDAGDAPMPAARVDFSIAPGGVGGFDAVSKQWVYIADAAAPAVKPNLYAPFYSQYIPATSRPDPTASGIDGPAQGNNFQGFLTSGQYTNWTPLLLPLVNDPLRIAVPDVPANNCKDEYGNFRPSPEGVPDTVSVYTDEHGEAIVAYNPDQGFYFDVGDGNTCDLGQNVPDNATGTTEPTSVVLGTSSITASAFYPYKSVAPVAQFVASDPLLKTVYGDPAKYLRCVPEDNRTDVMFCVEVIRDLYGNPVSGAKVQFTAEPGAKLVAAELELGGFDTVGQSYWGTPDNTTVYARTNDLGQVGVEVISTLKGQVDLAAENIKTRNGGSGIMRDACITYGGTGVPTATYANGGCAAAPGGNTTPPTGNDTGTTTTTTSSTTATTAPVTSTAVVSTAPAAPVSVTPTQTPPASPVGLPSGIQKPAVKAKLVSAKLVMTKVGQRYLQVKVLSSKTKATIKVTLFGKNGKALTAVGNNGKVLKGANGKALKTVTRKVAANKLVRVPNLKIAKAVLRAKVSLVG